MKKIYIGIIFLLLLKITINSIIAVNNKANKQVKTKQTKTKSTTENKKAKQKTRNKSKNNKQNTHTQPKSSMSYIGTDEHIARYKWCVLLPLKISGTFNISEKYGQIDRKIEDLTTENILLRNRVDVLTNENIDIKEQIRSMLTQNTQINRNDEFVNAYTDSRDNIHLNHYEHNEPSFTETGRHLEEVDFQQIPDFNKSNPHLDAKEENYRVHQEFQQIPATTRSNEDLQPGQVEYQKKKRLLLGSGNINYEYLISEY